MKKEPNISPKKESLEQPMIFKDKKITALMCWEKWTTLVFAALMLYERLTKNIHGADLSPRASVIDLGHGQVKCQNKVFVS